LNEQLHSLLFLCRCLKPARHAKDIREDSVRWERVVQLANTAFVTPTLWTALVESGVQDAVPEDVAWYLSELHRMNQTRNDAIKQQIVEIIGTLNQVGVEPLLLKGAALLITGMLDDPASRIMIDIDVMIRIGEVEKVLETLSTLRYRSQVPDLSIFNSCQHLAPMFRSGEPAVIEIHTRLFHEWTDPEVVTNEDVWTDSVLLRINGLSLRVLSPSHSVIYNIVHSEVHHENFELGRISLRDLLDLAIISRFHSASIDWCSIEARMKRHNLGRVLRSYLHIGMKLFGSPVPHDFRPTAGSTFHYYRCLLVLSFPALSFPALKVFRLFSANRMQRRFGCSSGVFQLARTRMSYAWYLVRNYAFGPKRGLLLTRLQEKGIIRVRTKSKQERGDQRLEIAESVITEKKDL
jgi:Uncharacterised nucleotidyltransferase